MGVTKVVDPDVEEHRVTGRTTVVPSASWDVASSASQEIEGRSSLEVRWIFAGRLAAAMTEWFGRFSAQTITLEDAYLVDPYMPGLSVKVRERRALEVKAYYGSPGLLEVPGRARGRLESWRKWSFPFDRSSPFDLAGRGRGDPASWRTLSKKRRICWFSRSGEPTVARFPGPGERIGCAVELAEFRVPGQDWWTLGFESTGPGRAEVLRDQLEAAAALVFAQALPGGTELGIGDSMPYARWLRGQPGIGGNPA